MMSISSYSRIVLLALVGCLMHPAMAARDVRVGVYQNEPKVFVDERGAPAGFFVDIINDIARAEGWQLHYIRCDWSRCLEQLARGDLDIMLDVAHIPEREAQFDFGHEVVLSSWSVLYKQAGDAINSILDLQDKKVAVLNDSVQYLDIVEQTELFDVHPRFVVVPSFDAAFKLLQTKAVDYVLANRFYGAMHMDQYGAEETNILIMPSALKLAFPKGSNGELRRATDAHLKQLKQDKDSIYYRSLKRWLTPLDKSHIPGWARWAVLAAGIALVALAILVAILRYTVRLRTAQISQERQHYYHLSQHDPLTGLPNRLYFFDRLDQAMRDADSCQGRLHVFFIDLDQFKHINDSVGHGIGDHILRSVAGRLREAVQDDGLVTRLGGDEFAVLGNACGDQVDAAELARRLIAALDAPLVNAEHQFYLSISIGISVYPQDGSSAQEIMKHADAALFNAKDKGRKTFEFYRPGMSDQSMRHVALVSDLKEALARQQFIVHYQPQFDLAGGGIVGMEALVRWQHPDKGLIPPDHFIPVAEDAGMISELGEWVLRTACQQMVAWKQQGMALRQIAVNVSPKQFHDETFYSRVVGIIADTGCAPECIDIEITESTILDTSRDNLGTLQQLRALGFGVAIDDFGTGHSSLSRLKHLPVSKLKIDISFIQSLPDDASDQAIVRAIIALGNGLGLTVLAEGIEREQQRDFLRDAGCTVGQGYLYSRPLPADQATRMLNLNATGQGADSRGLL